MRDFCVELTDGASGLAGLGDLLGSAGVNIDGLSVTECGGRSIVHFVVTDADAARRALSDAGIDVLDDCDVFVLHKDRKQVTGKPGSFGDICRTLAQHGIQIRFGYPAEHNQFVFGLDNIEKARELLD